MFASTQKHNLVLGAAAFGVFCAQRANAQLDYTNIQYNETATASATDGNPANQSFSNQNVLTNDQSATAGSGSSPGAQYATATNVQASQNDTLTPYTITAGGGAQGYASAQGGATATSTGTTSFSATFQVSTPEEFVLTGSLAEFLGSDNVSFADPSNTLYQASSNAAPAGTGSATVSYSLLLTPGVSYTLQANSTMTNNDNTNEQGQNSWNISASVPEPSTAALTLIAACSLVRRRRKSQLI